MIMQFVRFRSGLSEDDVLKLMDARAPQYRELPGLLQKYYVRDKRNGGFGGSYICYGFSLSPGRPKKSEPPRTRFSGTMSRSGTAEEPRLFTLHPIPVCLLFTLFALIPATLTLSQPQGRLCLLFSLSSLKKTVFTRFSSRDPLASKKQTPIWGFPVPITGALTPGPWPTTPCC